jgi:hypothetical protein
MCYKSSIKNAKKYATKGIICPYPETALEQYKWIFGKD